MLDLTRCRFKFDKEIPVKSGSVVNAEGLALISELEDGSEVVKVSAGTATEKFIGFSYGEKFTAATMSMVVSATIPGSGTYTVTLPRNNVVADNIFVFDNTANVALVEGTVADGVFACNDTTGVITFDAAQKGHTVTVTFRYYPTTFEIMNDTDQVYYKPSGTDFLGQIGVILSGEVFTDIYDAGVDWSAATAIKTGADGVLTDQTGAGATVNATIINVPNAENSFLGLRFGY